MALGTNSFANSGPLIFLSPRSKDKNKQDVPPHFEVGRANDKGEIVNDATTVTNVSGDLFKLEIKERTFEDNVTKDAVLYLRDKTANESYRLPIRFGITGRGFFNRLASLTEKGDFTGLQIDYYRNKAGYDNFGLKQHSENVSWKFANEDLPKPLEIKHPTTGKVLQRDYTEVNALFEQELLAIAAKVNKTKPEEHAPAAQKAPASAPKPATASKAAAATPDEDVPF